MSHIRTIAALLALAVLTGCSSFDHDWDVATLQKPLSPTDITGRWQGTWISEADHHSGGLRCLITQIDKDTYHARYAATFGGIFRCDYEMNLDASLIQDWVHFQGDADLGVLAGGRYECEGDANSEKFFATYKSSADHGQFNMKRPQ